MAIHIDLPPTGNNKKDIQVALASLKKAIKKEGILQDVYDRQEFSTKQQKSKRKRMRAKQAQRKTDRMQQKRDLWY